MTEFFNTILLPLSLANDSLKIVGHTYCPENRLYLIDGKGDVFLYENLGRIPEVEREDRDDVFVKDDRPDDPP